MPHEAVVPMEKKNGSNKLESININILDDGTYVVRFVVEDYSKSREYSYQNVNDLLDGIENDLKPIRARSYKKDELKDDEKKSNLRN